MEEDSSKSMEFQCFRLKIEILQLELEENDSSAEGEPEHIIWFKGLMRNLCMVVTLIAALWSLPFFVVVQLLYKLCF